MPKTKNRDGRRGSRRLAGWQRLLNSSIPNRSPSLDKPLRPAVSGGAKGVPISSTGGCRSWPGPSGLMDSMPCGEPPSCKAAPPISA
jgi:hypothetical protein